MKIVETLSDANISIHESHTLDRDGVVFMKVGFF